MKNFIRLSSFLSIFRSRGETLGMRLANGGLLPIVLQCTVEPEAGIFLPDYIKTTVTQDYHKFSKLAKNFITQYM